MDSVYIANGGTTRRRFVEALIVGGGVFWLTEWPTQSRAQTKVPRVGILHLSEDALKRASYQPFVRVLIERGWQPGKNVMLEYRFARGERLQFDDAAEELVRLDVDIVVALSAPATRAAYAKVSATPIVALDYTNDPVAVGYADSYSRPGRNLTGVFLDAPDFAGKWIELLKAIVPGLRRMVVLWDPAPGVTHLKALQSAARPLGLQLDVQEIRTPDDFEKAFLKSRGAQALIILPSPMTWTHSGRLADLALKYRLPATSFFREFADAGGAISYGPDLSESIERNAVQVAKILAGAKPGDLPIERPTKFDFLINMKTVRALGLKVPDSLLPGAEQLGR